ncbi:alpha-galactosidase [Streptococcus fryi]
MSIQFNQETQEFHLYNDEMSYIMHILPNEHLGQLYYGKKVSPKGLYTDSMQSFDRPLTSFVNDDETYFSLQHARQEYACYGTSDFALPAFEIKQHDGSTLSHFVYQSHMIYQGKKALDGLPHTYANDEKDCETLEVTLWDEVSQTRLILAYTIFSSFPVVTRSARFEQIGKPIVLTRALSMSLDLPDKDYEWLHLDGAWGRERFVQTSPLHQGVQSIYSLKGSSSSEHNPFIALKRPYTTEHSGEVIGFSLVYSGNFLAQVDVSSYNQTRVSLGINPHRFSWLLQAGDTFQTPEVVMVYSEDGLNGMSQTYHKLYQHHLIRGFWKDKERPILLNNWEAMTFDFDEERILELAGKAASVGVELFVMDDGWFGARNHDRAGLGDWTVNRTKLPSGLSGVISKIHDMKLKFGLWIEPEMVNKDSDLYRAHPDWILHHPAHTQSHGRHQYTLDLSREDVYQNIHQQLFTLLSGHDIDYIKWDMNRYLTEVYNSLLGHDRQGEVFHRYMLNVYRLYDSLTTAFPTILFESCSSGGGRFDPGMLFYAPQTWTSDNSDAIERLKIQYGTSIVYPLSSMGCHVSESPNQQMGRITSLETRTNVAYFGNFGYEIDLSKCDQEELDRMAEHIVFYKKYRTVFQKGTFTRLMSPFDGDLCAWQVVSEDKKTVIAGVYRLLGLSNQGQVLLYFKDLEEDAEYLLNGRTYSGSQLMYMGVPIYNNSYFDSAKDFNSELFILEKQVD